MKTTEILNKIDHTVLNPEATWSEIETAFNEGVKFNAASVCIPPSYVEKGSYLFGSKIKICTVIGFPLGYQTTKTKLFEALDAIKAGADEIDMVINIGLLKDKEYGLIENEIREIKSACEGHLLKVIIEACLLNKDEKIKMCEIISASGADFIKTSTGFSTFGASKEDIVLFKKHLPENIGIKAAGGIKTLESAEEFIALGASRIGSSAILKNISGLIE